MASNTEPSLTLSDIATDSTNDTSDQPQLKSDTDVFDPGIEVVQSSDQPQEKNSIQVTDQDEFDDQAIDQPQAQSNTQVTDHGKYVLQPSDEDPVKIGIQATDQDGSVEQANNEGTSESEKGPDEVGFYNKTPENDDSNVVALKGKQSYDQQPPTLCDYMQEYLQRYQNDTQITDCMKDENFVMSTAGRKVNWFDFQTLNPRLEKPVEEKVKKYFGENHWEIGWIANTIINAIGGVLQQEPKHRIHILDTSITWAILNEDWSLWKGNEEAINAYKLFLWKAMEELHRLMVPLLIKFHWCLLVYDVNDKEFRWYDSLWDKSRIEAMTSDQKKGMIETVEPIVSFLFPNEVGRIIKESDISPKNPFDPQNDENNCGVFLCMYMMEEAGLLRIMKKQLNTEDARLLIRNMLFKYREIILSENEEKEVDLQEIAMKPYEETPDQDDGNDVIKLKEKKEIDNSTS